MYYEHACFHACAYRSTIQYSKNSFQASRQASADVTRIMDRTGVEPQSQPLLSSKSEEV